MSIIFFIIIVFFVILIFASSIIFSIIRWVLSLLGIGVYRSRGGYNKRQQTYTKGEKQGTYRSNTNVNDQQWHFTPEEEYKRKKRKKIIASDEGEYVDFEEIKK